jgi:hypothetical protein
MMGMMRPWYDPAVSMVCACVAALSMEQVCITRQAQYLHCSGRRAGRVDNCPNVQV